MKLIPILILLIALNLLLAVWDVLGTAAPWITIILVALIGILKLKGSAAPIK